jgi:integrase
MLRFERAGRERWHGLGSVSVWSLREARERARAARQLLADGIDPIDAKKAAKAAAALKAARALTFEEAAKQYYTQHERKWRNAKHSGQFLSTLRTYAFPKIGRLSIADIDTGQVLRCIEPIWHEKTETASQVRGRIEKVLDWATVRGFRTGDNPARWRGHLSELLPAPEKIQKPKHHASLPWAKLPAFMAGLQERAGSAARALEFAILTAARTGEVIGAQWEEIDLTAGVWSIPAGRMKAGKAHRVPLSPAALSILGALPREAENDFVFIGGQRGGGLSNMAMATLLKRMNCHDITVHGFRSSFMDWAHERTSYPKHVIDMALAHAIGDKVEAAYRRGDLFDKRRRLMEEWAHFVMTPQPEAKVIDIREARSAK